MKHADTLDFATDLQQAEIDNAVNARVIYQGVSLSECIECGEDIPEARQNAIKGCKLCVKCQTKKERR